MALTPKDKFYKKFFSASDIFYPMRPLFTLSVGVLLFSLGLTGFFGASFLIFLGVILTTDDLTLYPWLRVNKLYSNYSRGYKTLKSGLGLAVISLALIAGLALGIFVLASNPTFLAGLIALKAAMDSSITVAIACEVIGALTAKYFGKPALFGIVVGATVAIFIPISIPLVIEAAVLSTTLSIFFSAILVKQTMRLYNKLKYGHSNADGYNFAHETDKVLDIDKTQALVYDVQPEQIKNLRKALIESVKNIKQISNVLNDMTGSTGQMTTAYKDMFQLLTTAKTEEEANLLREMIEDYWVYTSPNTSSYDTITPAFTSDTKNEEHTRRFQEAGLKNLEGALKTSSEDYVERYNYLSFWNKQGFESSIAWLNDSDNPEIRKSASNLREAFSPMRHSTNGMSFD